MGAPPCYLQKVESELQAGLLIRSFVPDTRLVEMKTSSRPNEYWCIPIVGIPVTYEIMPLYLASLKPTDDCWGQAKDVSALVLWKNKLYGVTLHHFEVVNDE